MKLLVVLAVLVVACQALTFKNPPPGNGCSYPDWKCNCKLIYNCGVVSGFPDYVTVNDAKLSGCIKDLSPDNYQLRITGKRWRREIWSQEEFCKLECYDRMNAFLCLGTDGALTPYSYAAICLKLIGLGTVGANTGPFNQDGGTTAEPCCEMYLQWGLNWCTEKWNKLIGTTHCLTDTTGAIDEADIVYAPSDSYFFTAAYECTVGVPEDGWCGAIGCS